MDHRLFVPMLICMSFRRLHSMVRRVCVMPVSYVCVVSGFLVSPGLVMLSRHLVMLGRLLVMIRRFAVMLCCLF
jgi:hypothetical protein